VIPRSELQPFLVHIYSNMERAGEREMKGHEDISFGFKRKEEREI
jgi:hypothetical protein